MSQETLGNQSGSNSVLAKIGICPRCDGSLWSGTKVCGSCGWIVESSKVVKIWKSPIAERAKRKEDVLCKWGYDTCRFCGTKILFQDNDERIILLADHYIFHHPRAVSETMREELDLYSDWARWGCPNPNKKNTGCREIMPQDLIGGKHSKCGYNVVKQYLRWQIAMKG